MWRGAATNIVPFVARIGTDPPRSGAHIEFGDYMPVGKYRPRTYDTNCWSPVPLTGARGEDLPRHQTQSPRPGTAQGTNTLKDPDAPTSRAARGGVARGAYVSRNLGSVRLRAAFASATHDDVFSPPDRLRPSCMARGAAPTDPVLARAP